MASPSPHPPPRGEPSDIEKQDDSPHDLQASPLSDGSGKQGIYEGDNTFPDVEAEPAGHVSDDDASEEVQQQGLSEVMNRVLSRVSTRSSFNPGPPPDGGFHAWMITFCTHIVIMNSWGFLNSFGSFQTYYTTALSLPPSTISWIGSVQVFLLFFIGTFTGRITDAGYFRPIYLLGFAFEILGIFATANSTQYWQFFLAQGVCMGIGEGCLFCPSLTVLSSYFSRNRAFALGLAACGSATGGLIFPSMVRQLLPAVGFVWTVRAIGFIQLACLSISFIFLRPRVPPRRSGPLVEFAAFKELDYTFYACGSFFCYWGVYFAFYYISSFSRDVIGMGYTDSLNMLLIMNGLGIPGRLVPNYIADRAGTINIFIVTAAMTIVCVLGWIAVTSATGLYVWVIIYGFSTGGVQSLFPAGISSLTTDIRKSGVRLGMVFTITSFATLTGPPIGGAIITACGGKYYGAQIFVAAVMFVGTCFMIAARAVRIKKIGGSKGWRTKV